MVGMSERNTPTFFSFDTTSFQLREIISLTNKKIPWQYIANGILFSIQNKDIIPQKNKAASIKSWKFKIVFSELELLLDVSRTVYSRKTHNVFDWGHHLL